jgi:tetratricopeptide (TPR) repeat protein
MLYHFGELKMRSSQSQSRCQRTFHQVLEEMPPGRRFLVAANPPARAGAADVRYLVEKSFALRYSDISGMYHYAKLASVLASALPRRSNDLQHAKGEAWIQLGAALRVLGHLQSSQQAFSTAEEELSRGSLRPDIQARLWEWRGSLYRDWRNFEEAENCLASALYWHSQAGELGDSNRCLVSRALCAGKGGNPERAVRLAERATRNIDSKARPDLAVSALHALCWYLVDLRKPKLADACYVEGEPLFNILKDELIQTHRTWLRAHINHALELHSSAETLYRRAADGFAKQEDSYERALVLLDLCLPLASQNRLDELAAIAAEIIPEFERIGISREATASRLLLSAATQASVAQRVKALVKVSNLVQQSLPPARELPEP